MKKTTQIFLITILVMLGILLTTTFFFSCSDDEKEITASELPSSIQRFVSKYFSGKNITYSEKDGESEYFIRLDDYTEIFFENGQWQSIFSFEGVPTEILPSAITFFLEQNHSDTTITEAERNNYTIELLLSNHRTLIFDANGVFLGEELVNTVPA